MASGHEIDQASAIVSVSTTEAAASRRIEFVDGVRALAALFVVAHHMDLTVYGFPTNTAPSVLAPLLYGDYGVAIFIVVSGFSLGLAPARRGWQLGRGGYWTFMRRRAWRILPPYWAALAVSVALVMLLSTRIDDPVSWKGVATHFFLVQDVVEGKTPNGAFWSIAVEWQLYWIFPLLLLIRRRPGPIVLTSAVLGIVIAIGIAADHGGGHVVHKMLGLSPQLGALFVYGLVAAAAISRPAAAECRWWGLIAVIAGGAVVITCAFLGTALVASDSLWLFYWLDLVIGIAVATVLVWLVGTATSCVHRCLEWRPLVAIGQFSYSLYLIHAPLLAVAWVFLVKPLGFTPGAAFALMVGVVGPAIVAASYGFHRVAERPFMKCRSWSELRAAYAARHTAG